MPWRSAWPFTIFRKDGCESSKPEDIKEKLRDYDWGNFTQPSTVISTLVLTSGLLVGTRVYKRFLRRIPNVEHIRPEQLREGSVFGKVTSVGDGDNFRIYHTPGGRLAGWGWLLGRRLPTTKAGLKDQTLHIRIAGVDAPELAHFGRPAQEYGQEALDWLTGYLHNKRVRVYMYRKDQYGRVVGTAWVRKWGIRRDIGLEMLKRGLATVYEAKWGSEFGMYEQKYRLAMERAKQRQIGMWKEPTMLERLLGGEKKPASESPREFKTRMAAEENAKK